jgi:hypothetical protein
LAGKPSDAPLLGAVGLLESLQLLVKQCCLRLCNPPQISFGGKALL